MDVKGKYIREINTFRECKIYIERGNLYEVSVPDLPPMKARFYIPKNESEFSFKRLPSRKKGLIPHDSNYIIEYFGKYGNTTNRIYLKLNLLRLTRVKWVLREYPIQSKKMKIDIMKYIIGAVIGLVFGYIGSKFIS